MEQILSKFKLRRKGENGPVQTVSLSYQIKLAAEENYHNWSITKKKIKKRIKKKKKLNLKGRWVQVIKRIYIKRIKEETRKKKNIGRFQNLVICFWDTIEIANTRHLYPFHFRGRHYKMMVALFSSKHRFGLRTLLSNTLGGHCWLIWLDSSHETCISTVLKKNQPDNQLTNQPINQPTNICGVSITHWLKRIKNLYSG